MDCIHGNSFIQMTTMRRVPLIHRKSAKMANSLCLAWFSFLVALVVWSPAVAFSPQSRQAFHSRSSARIAGGNGLPPLGSALPSDDICTVQILMSDTGGGHRASANALRDAFDVLYPGRIVCDIVDIYTDYGPFWPYNDYVAMYKFMAKYPWTWDAFYQFGCTEFGMCVNAVMLETFCFEPFTECLNRPSPPTSKRADMVVSVHPLTQDIPLKILAHLDSNGKTRDPRARTTPFCTVVTDLGSAHPTWFNPG